MEQLANITAICANVVIMGVLGFYIYRECALRLHIKINEEIQDNMEQYVGIQIRQHLYEHHKVESS